MLSSTAADASLDVYKRQEQLEEDLGRELTDVCIAAAGRVLRTVTTYVAVSYTHLDVYKRQEQPIV